MAWFMTIREGGEPPWFEWEDKSGFRADEKTPLPFSKWSASAKVSDVSNIPTIAVQTDTAPLTDAFWIRDAGVISARFRQIIEDFEPGVHQFFPVTLKRKNGSPYEEEYFIFHPTRRVPCVLLSESGVKEVIIVKYGERAGKPIPSVHEDEYCISRPAIEGYKVFGSLYLMNHGLFVTDDVMARIQAEKIRILRVHPVRELDKPFVFEKEAPDVAAWLDDHPQFWNEMGLEPL